MDKGNFNSDFVNKNLAKFVPVSYIPRYYVAIAYQDVLDKTQDEKTTKTNVVILNNAS